MTDPFLIKRYPKAHPRRLAFTALARCREQIARMRFAQYELPSRILAGGNTPEVDWSDTEVTREQMRHLMLGVAATRGPIVEVGAYRGVTTLALASSGRPVTAVDPFIGYGGSDQDYQRFLGNTSGTMNIRHWRMTSGEAARGWAEGAIGFVFIDAVHDYVNTSFDVQMWGSLLGPGGIIALHDTDLRIFAGTRKAAHEAAKGMTLFAHPDNLVLLQKRG